MTYHVRKWCEGETKNLRLYVCDPTGRSVFSSPSYDEVIAERDRLNAGGAEVQTLTRGPVIATRLADGAVRYALQETIPGSVW